MVKRAIQLGFNHLGFSSHAPIEKDNNFSIKEEKIPDYIMVFGKKKNLSHDLLNNLENLINSIEEIKQKFEIQ